MQSIEKSYFRNEDCSFSPPLQVVNRTDDPGKRANNSHDTQIDIQADEFQKMVLEMERAVKAENGNIRKQRSMFLSSADEVYSNVIEEIVPRLCCRGMPQNFYHICQLGELCCLNNEHTFNIPTRVLTHVNVPIMQITVASVEDDNWKY
jgi:hypothetical protein